MHVGSGRAALQIALLAASVVALASWPASHPVEGPTSPPVATAR